MEITFKELSMDEIDLVKPLWQKLNTHHIQCSEFRKEFKKNIFEKRINKIKDNNLKIMAGYNDENKIICYSITSISPNDVGELDSIYVEENYRGTGIGKKLMEMSLEWLDQNGIDDIFIIVAAGNENALNFYNEFGFKPRAYKLKRLS